MKQLVTYLCIALLAHGIAGQATVNVRGYILDSDDGLPVADAWVHLIARNVSDSTGSDGSFRFSASAALPSGRAAAVPDLFFSRWTARFSLVSAQRVSIALVTLNGRAIILLSGRILSPGAYALPLPHDLSSSNVWLLRAEFGARSICRKMLQIEGSAGIPLSEGGISGPALAKEPASVDTLQIVRKGYVSRKLPVTTYADSIDAAIVWRPFNDVSPWNVAIPSTVQVDDSSAALIQDLSVSSQWNFLGINIKGYSVPVYYTDSASVPKYLVTCADVTGWMFDKAVPIPDGAKPDSLSDHHICIIDKKLGREWGMWNAVKLANNTWQCGVGAACDLGGTGVRPPAPQANPWQLAHSARASGFPLIAGLIRVGEIKGGRIDHALAVAYPHCRSRYFVTPASTAQGTTSDALPTRGIPMGGRIQLDPSINVDTLKISATGKIIARALQEYGAYVCDYSGAINLYADGSAQACKVWDAGVLTTYEISQIFNANMLRRFRVIKLPPFYDNNN